MKKIIFYLLAIPSLFLMANCSDSSDSNIGGGENSTPVSGDGKGGSLAVFSLKNNYLYTVDTNRLHVFQISDPTNPIQVNSIEIGFDIETIYNFNDYLFIGSRSGMQIYNIQNPESPQFMSDAQHATACDPVVADDHYAYVTLNSNTFCGNNINTLLVYNITNIYEPVLLHQRNLVNPKGLAIYENYLIVCDDELKIFDIAQPSQPLLIKSFQNRFTDVVIYNETLYAFGDKTVNQYKWSDNNFETITPISQLSY